MLATEKEYSLFQKRIQAHQKKLQGFIADAQNGFMCVSLPYSDLQATWLQEGSIHEDIQDSFKTMGRLGSVRTLSFLTFSNDYFENFIESLTPDRWMWPVDFGQTRFDHSVVVELVGERIARRNNFKEPRVNALVTACALHDIATPGFGDAAKSVDPKNLDEETHWQDMINALGWEFLARHGMTQNQISAMIVNLGVDGQILDIADRITYVLKDWRYLIEEPISLRPRYFGDLQIQALTEQNPKVGNIYKDVRVNRNEQVYFSNPNRLDVFLTMRALLHQYLYLNPVSQGRDLFLANMIRPFYATDGSLPFTPQGLRELGDLELHSVLTKLYGEEIPSPFSPLMGLRNWRPDSIKTTDEQETHEVARTVIQSADKTFLGVKKIRGFSTGAHYLVKDPKTGEIMPFGAFNPQAADSLKEHSTQNAGTYVYYTSRTEYPEIARLLDKERSFLTHPEVIGTV